MPLTAGMARVPPARTARQAKNPMWNTRSLVGRRRARLYGPAAAGAAPAGAAPAGAAPPLVPRPDKQQNRNAET